MKSYFHSKTIVSFSVALSPLSSVALADEFTERVAAAFAEEKAQLQPSIRTDNEIALTLKSGEVSVFLDNLRTACFAAPNDCDAEIRSYVRRVSETIRNAPAAGLTSTNVYPVLRSEGWFSALQQSAGKGERLNIESRPFLPGIVLVYVVDTPSAFRFVNDADLRTSDISSDRLHTFAGRNAARLETLPVKRLEGAPGLFAAIAQDGLGTSRVLDRQFWALLEQKAGGPVAVAVPTRDWVLAARLDNRQALTALQTIADRIVKGEANSVSPTIFRRSDDSWQTVTP